MNSRKFSVLSLSMTQATMHRLEHILQLWRRQDITKVKKVLRIQTNDRIPRKVENVGPMPYKCHLNSNFKLARPCTRNTLREQKALRVTKRKAQTHTYGLARTRADMHGHARARTGTDTHGHTRKRTNTYGHA